MLKKSFFKIKSTCETLGKLSSVGAPESRELRPLSWSLNVLIIMGGGGGGGEREEEQEERGGVGEIGENNVKGHFRH